MGEQWNKTKHCREALIRAIESMDLFPEYERDGYTYTIHTEYSHPYRQRGRVDVWVDDHTRDGIAIEIKTSKADMWSGYGNNYFGSTNYLCVPTDLLGDAIIYLQEHDVLHDVGVIEVPPYTDCRIVIPSRRRVTERQYTFYCRLVEGMCNNSHSDK